MRYNLQQTTGNLFNSLFSMFSPGGAAQNHVEITRDTHLPIMLLHKKFFLILPSQREK